MITQISYNVLIDRFRAFAAGHYLIKQFTHGHPSAIDIEKGLTFPWMHVFPVEVEPRPGSRLYSFIVTFADLPRDKETPTEYEREIISDCIKLAEDLVAEIQNGLVLFGPTVELEGSPSIEVFIQEYSQTLTGVNLAITLSVPWDWSACDIPADWTVGGSGSGGTGVGVGLVLRTNGVNNAVQSLLNLQQGTNITLVDQGNGTILISATGGGGGGGVSSVGLSMPSGFSVSGSPVTSSGTLAVTGNGDASEYIDGTGALQTFPTIPAAQVNSDWDAVSGVAEILNKPILATVATSGDYNDLINTPGTPDLQAVTDAGNTTTNDLLVQGANDFIGQVSSQVVTVYNTVTGAYAEMSVNTGGQLVLSDGSTAGILSANNLNGNIQLEFPDKTTGTYTIATTDEIIAQVNSDWNAVGGVAEILNKPTIPVNLDDLGDVNAAAPTNGQVLAFNSTSGDWEPITPTSGGSVTSVGLSMPSAFTVSGSPVTTAGTLAVSGAGTTDQYIRGDGTLANFPSTGGGGGQIFYFNGNVAQPSIGGNNYFQLGTNANTGPAANFTRATTGVIARFITNVGSPNHLIIPSGVWTIDVYLSETGGGANHAQILAKLYTYNGSTFTLIATSTMEEITNGNVPDLYTFTISVPSTVTAATDRVHIEFDIQNTNGKTVTLYTEASRIGEVHSTYAIGLSSLNGLTANTQTFATGTTGTDFGINSSGSVHTFNLPTASASNRGALSSADWSTFNGKQNTVGFTDVGTAIATIPNPSATRYLRINSNNSVTAITASTLKSELLAGTAYGVVAYGSAFVNFVPASTTTYGTITSGIIAFNTTIANREFTIPFGGTVKNLYVHTSTQQAAGGSLVISVMQNQINTALSITIPALGVAAVRTNLTDTFTAVAGDKLVFRLINNHTNVSATIVSVSFIIEQL